MRTAVVDDRAPIFRTVLALVARAFDVPRRHRYGIPALSGPPGVVSRWSVFRAGDFATDGPIETGNGWRVHGRSSQSL